MLDVKTHGNALLLHEYAFVPEVKAFPPHGTRPRSPTANAMGMSAFRDDVMRRDQLDTPQEFPHTRRLVAEVERRLHRRGTVCAAASVRAPGGRQPESEEWQAGWQKFERI